MIMGGLQLSEGWLATLGGVVCHFRGDFGRDTISDGLSLLHSIGGSSHSVGGFHFNQGNTF